MRPVHLCLLACLLFVAQPINAQTLNDKAMTSWSNTDFSEYSATGDLSGIFANVSLTATTSAGETVQNSSQESSSAQTPFALRISQKDFQFQGHIATLAIIYDAGTEPISSFDFEFAFASKAYRMRDVTVGPALQSAGWTNFTYDTASFDSCVDLCPDVLLKIHANNASSGGQATSATIASTFSPGDTLALVNLLVSNDRNLACEFLALRWNWSNCNSNTLLSTMADTVYQSQSVFDYVGSSRDPLTNFRQDITGVTNSQAVPGGMPLTCDGASQGFERTELRFVDFKNGGTAILCDEIDVRGDINLNGISAELADLEMFAAYFAMGRTAFGTHQEGSIATSEVNGDGIPLTVSDMVYLIHIILGDAIPVFDLTHERDTVTITQRGDSIITDIPLGALHLVFEGETDVALIAPAYDTVYSSPMTIKVGMVGGNTHVLLYDIDGSLLRAGAILDQIQTILLSADASDFDGSLVAVKLDTGNNTNRIPFSFRITQTDELELFIPPGNRTSVYVVYDQGSEPISDFSFEMQYSAEFIRIENVLSGSALQELGWAPISFEIKSTDSCTGDCPKTILSFNSSTPASVTSRPETTFTSGDTIAVIDIFVVDDRFHECLFIPLRWNWSNCNSNILHSQQRDTTYQSLTVRDYIGTNYDPETGHRNDLAGATDSLFEAGGMPLSCDSIIQPSGVTALRFVEFSNGGVQTICCNDDDLPGDINGNCLAFEETDLRLYIDYFTLGDSAFAKASGDKYRTDTNADNKYLTVSDLTYMIRVMRSEELPESQLTHERDTVTITQRGDDIYSDMRLGALHLVFEGETTVKLEDDDDEHDGHGNGHDKGHGDSNLNTGNSILLTSLLDDDDDEQDSHDSRMTLEVGLVDGNTHVLIYNIGNNQLKAGEILDDVHAKLLSADASDFNGSFVVVRFDFVTDVGDGLGDNGTTLPTIFALHQNYPNPFNPTTTIEFSLPKRSDVELTIYNMLGQKLRTLVSESMQAGEHSLVWDGQDNSGSSVASGMYLYRLKVGENISQTRKMVLLK